MFTILSAVAEAERDRTRERITEVKRDQRQRGRYLGGTVPFGWTLTGDGGELIEDPPSSRRDRDDASAARPGARASGDRRQTLTETGMPISHQRGAERAGGDDRAEDRRMSSLSTARATSTSRPRSCASSPSSRERDIGRHGRSHPAAAASPEKPLPDVPLHKRGFGVMDEDHCHERPSGAGLRRGAGSSRAAAIAAAPSWSLHGHVTGIHARGRTGATAGGFADMHACRSNIG